MNIVDSQVHLWQAESPDRPWPPGRALEAQKPYPISKETMLFQMDLAGVRRAVIVPPSWEGDRNDVALAAAQTYPDRFAVMGRLGLKDPASPGKVAAWKQQPGMLGMRFTFHNEHYRHLLTDGSTNWLWPALEAAGIPIMIIMPDALDHLDRIVRQVIEYERRARRVLIRDAYQVTEDKIWRAYGLLRYARSLTFEEMMNLLSGVRLGAALKLLPGLRVYSLNKIMIFTQSAHLEDAAGRKLPPGERDAHRATYVRRILATEGVVIPDTEPPESSSGSGRDP